MSRLAEASLAATTALAAHLGLFAVMPQNTGPAAAASFGDAGAELLSLAAPPPALSDLINAWDAPPAVDPPTKQPALPAPEPRATVPSAVAAPMVAAPQAVSLPDADPAPAPATAPATAPPAKPVTAPAKPAKDKPAKDKPGKTPVAVPEQKAKGAGKGETAGTGGQAKAATATKAHTAQAIAEWGAQIRAKVERNKRAAGGKGKVVVRLVVGADGRLRGVSVAKSSGDAGLDRAALAAVKAAGRFPKAPDGVGEQGFTLPITFN